MTTSEGNDVPAGDESVSTSRNIATRLSDVSAKSSRLVDDGLTWFTPERVYLFSRIFKAILVVIFISAIIYWIAAFFFEVALFEW